MTDEYDVLLDSLSPSRTKAPKARPAVDYRKLYKDVGQKYGVDPDLLYNQAKHESIDFNPHYVFGPGRSPKGAAGLAQFMPDTARQYGLQVRKGQDDRFNPTKSADAHARLMRDLIDRYGDTQLALAAYNSGTNKTPEQSRRAMRRIPETRGYVQKIAPQGDAYDQLLNEQSGQVKRTQPKRDDYDDLLDSISEQTLPPKSLVEKAKSTPPRAASAPKKDAVQALQELMESTNRATARLQRQSIPRIDKSVPSMMDIAREAINSPEGRLKDQIREQVRRERPTGIRTPWNEGQPSQVGPDLENEEVARRFEQTLRADTPEMIRARKEYGRESAPVRAVTQPIGRFAAGALKTVGGITSAFGIAPNKVSDWANERGQFVEESTTNAPLTEAGEEIQRGIPEKVAQGVADLGITIGQLIALKRATRLPMNQLMALESGLKTSEQPAMERVKAATEAYALGTVLDQHLGRAASAALFGGPTALQTGAEVAAGRMSPEDALIQTGIQTGAGAVLGAKKPSAFKQAFERLRPREATAPDAEIAARLRGQRVPTPDAEPVPETIPEPTVAQRPRPPAEVTPKPPARTPPVEQTTQAAQPAPTETTAPTPAPVEAVKGVEGQLFHGTRDVDVATSLKKASPSRWTHLGSEEQARAFHKTGTVGEVERNFKNPAVAGRDANWSNEPLDALDALTHENGPFKATEPRYYELRDEISKAKSVENGFRILSGELERQGYDAIRYPNEVEGQGDSYIVWRPESAAVKGESNVRKVDLGSTAERGGVGGTVLRDTVRQTPEKVATEPTVKPVEAQDFDVTTTEREGKKQFIFKRSGVEVGEIAMRPRADGNYEVSNVLVWPKFQRKGAATEFYRRAFEQAQSEGKKLFISSDRTPDAIALHEQFAKRGLLKSNGEINFAEPAPKPVEGVRRASVQEREQAALRDYTSESGEGHKGGYGGLYKEGRAVIGDKMTGAAKEFIEHHERAHHIFKSKSNEPFNQAAMISRMYEQPEVMAEFAETSTGKSHFTRQKNAENLFDDNPRTPNNYDWIEALPDLWAEYKLGRLDSKPKLKQWLEDLVPDEGQNEGVKSQQRVSATPTAETTTPSRGAVSETRPSETATNRAEALRDEGFVRAPPEQRVATEAQSREDRKAAEQAKRREFNRLANEELMAREQPEREREKFRETPEYLAAERKVENSPALKRIGDAMLKTEDESRLRELHIKWDDVVKRQMVRDGTLPKPSTTEAPKPTIRKQAEARIPPKLSRGPGAAAAKGRAGGEDFVPVKERKFGKRFVEDERIAQELRDSIGTAKYYEPIPNKVTAENATNLVNERGVGESIKIIRDENNQLPHHVRSTMGQIVIQRLNKAYRNLKESNPKEAEFVLDQATDLAEWQMDYGTRLGQGVQSFAMWARLTPEGKLLTFKRGVQKAIKKRQQKNPEEVREVKEIVDEVNKRVAGESEVTREATDEASKTIRRAASQQAQKAKAKPDDVSVWQRYKDSIAQQLADIANPKGEKPRPPLQEFSERLLTNVEGLIAKPERAKRPNDVYAKMREVVENFDKYKEAWNEAVSFIRQKYEGKSDAELSAIERRITDLHSAFQTRAFDKVYRDAIKQAEINFKELAKAHFKDRARTKDDLIRDIQKRLGIELSPEDARALADRVTQRTAARIIGAREKILEAMAKKNKTARKVLSQSEKLIEAARLGVLNEQKFYEIAAEKLGLPKYDKQVAAKVLELAGRVEDAAEGMPKDEAIFQLNKYMAEQKGFDVSDLPLGIYYGNILSGYNTQIVNTVDTALNVMSEVNGLALANPRAAARIYAGLIRGLGEGKLDALLALNEGRRTTDQKWLEVPRLMEIAKFGKKGGVPIKTETRAGRTAKAIAESRVAYPLNAYKYVGRLMSASDAVFQHGAKEARASLLAHRMAQQAGLKGDALDAKVREILALDRKADFLEQAKREGYEGTEAEARAVELMEMVRDKDLTADTAEFAGEATYNHEPHGVMGYFSKKVGDAAEHFPPLKLFVPFTRIVANVTNRGLNYTPYGFKHALKGYGYGRLAEGSLSPEARQLALIRATAGTVGMVGLGALQQMGVLQIHGAGPSDRERKRQLQQAGWRPYSIQIGDKYISYVYTPIGLGLSLVGNMTDAGRYHELSQKDVGTRAAYTVMRLPSTVFNQSFLSGLNRLFSALGESGSPGETVSAVKQSLSSTSSALVVPNIARDITRLFDNKAYQSNTLMEDMVRSTPFAGPLGLRPQLNAFGEPVKVQRQRFLDVLTSDPAWRFVIQKGLRVPVPSRTAEVEKDRRITPSEYYELIQKTGPKLKQWILDNQTRLSEMKEQDAQEELSQASGRITRDEMDTLRSKLGVGKRKKSTFTNPFTRPRRTQRQFTNPF